MIFKSEQDFAQKLKNYGPRRVYFLYGEQTYLKKRYLQKIIGLAVEPGMADFNLTRLDGAAAGIDAVSDAVEALPVMAPRKCVVVADLDVGKLSAAETDKLADLLADPPETTVLVWVLWGLAADVKKNAKWKAFVKLVDAVGDVVELGPRTAAETARFVRALAERAGCSMAGDSAYYLIERCGDDMQTLKNEIEKLCAYRGAGEITHADIDLCVTAQLDASVFDLAKRIIQGDYRRAMQSLADLMDLREEPVVVLGALSGSFVDLYRARVARECGRTAADLTGGFKAYKGKEWRVKNAMRDCNRFTRRQLAEMVDLLARADFRLKSSKCDPSIVLQETVTRMFACCAGQGGTSL